ncbi:MAG: chemotaxis protein CheR [Deltaproteobacteria bacterium]|nr:chemotaxis protein CheR [Deltaproteobacteria bacterium]
MEETSIFSLIQISDAEFFTIRDMVFQQAGIHLTIKKKPLVVGRLHMLLREKEFNNYNEYIQYVQSDQTGKALEELVDKISTNHTYFFREEAHFNFFLETALPNVIAQIAKRGEKDLRIWSAGCATGEEAYMLVMLMKEALGERYKDWDAGVLATDISNNALAVAKQAVYPLDKAHQLPPHLRKKYTLTTQEDQIEIHPDIRKEVTFRRFNLMSETFPFKKPFHIIFCRNVMIYFEEATRQQLIQKFRGQLVPQGYLFIGHAETLRAIDEGFHYLRPAVYQKEF